MIYVIMWCTCFKIRQPMTTQMMTLMTYYQAGQVQFLSPITQPHSRGLIEYINKL